MDFVFYFFICIAATTLGAIAGIGGGVIIKPVLDALGGLNVSAIGFLRSEEHTSELQSQR